MTGASNTKLLPLPERFDCTNGNTPWCQGCYTMTPDEYGDYVQWEDYERITAAQAAEIERLRAEVAEWKRVAAAQAELHGEAEARANRLAGALREICKGAPESEPGDDARDSGNHDDMAGEAADWEHYRLANIARAALDQEVGNG